VEDPGPYAADELLRKTVTALHVGADAVAFLSRQRARHLSRMRQVLAEQATVDDPSARIALDHTLAHLDADLRWLETAAARVSGERKRQR
jgi:hypothetical protein